MKRKLLLLFVVCFLCLTQSFAQQKTITGKILDEDRLPLPGASVKVKGLPGGSISASDGVYSIKAAPGQILVYSFIGTISQEITVGTSNSIDVVLRTDANQLSEVQITGALGIKDDKKAAGASIQSVSGAVIAQTQRENFVNGLQGRIAGLTINSTSGVPGASSQIILRGFSSVNSNNQPLIVIDGIPSDNSTMNTANFASSMASNSSLENRGTDFTNRSSDFSPEDIEDITVLKGPEAAALYGIDAANGAIIITTKRGKAGDGRINYSNSFRIDQVTSVPNVQDVYGLGTNGVLETTTISYFGPKYQAGTKIYDNVSEFFETALTQKHNLSFEGGTDKATYRVSSTYTQQNGAIPNTSYDRFTLGGSTAATLNKWLKIDLSLNYSYSRNDKVFKGSGGPLIGLLIWPRTDDARDYLTPAGLRRKFWDTLPNESQLDNPYFNINKNSAFDVNNRIFSSTSLILTPIKDFTFTTRVGFDIASFQSQNVYHPESYYATTRGGAFDQLTQNTRNINVNSFVNYKKEVLPKFNISALAGGEIKSEDARALSAYGEKFLEPNFASINNTDALTRRALSTIVQRRVASLYGQVQMNYNKLVYVTVTGRNDWTSTLPIANNSFFYPSVSTSFNFTDLKGLEGLKKILNSGKIRASIAQVGRDARPYKIYPALQYENLSAGGYRYGFTGPNPTLKPEIATSYEFGADLSFLKSRINLEFTYYKKKTDEQIVRDIRASYGTGFVLTDLNGGNTQNHGYEVLLTGKPILTKDFSWNVIANFDLSRSKLLSLPRDVPESYSSDTWLYGNVRGGAQPGQPLTQFTGNFYLRNNAGEILISPATGLPLRSTAFISNGSDRWPDWTLGLTNEFGYKNFRLSFLIDFRKGGDVLNATEHYLTQRGLTTRTLDRETPRVIKGVLQDGLENSAKPTPNNIVVNPYYDSRYYSSISEELFIEKDINWIRMRDITLSYTLSSKLLARQKFVKSASFFATATDVFLITNYSGADPIANGNNAATVGAGGMAIDFGNFPTSLGINFGVRIGL
ncbi:SusC/RagA family TonB-linked outer membrane protein [Pedobacter boryungensis]|uniref:SusC/RagA family TonB-linked outer membrane protein n=1 Tax=Pedobacter boryungensis TaxID=869962 RepID=A0ABX2DFS2_9SPHI|nr:SusC/RagA family TonB-linked outer membrane protein [Pedobacter boryungensis]NQX32877.1 SusC/RagA family TonB-linked outer membrane protein [Pedobacter boryungensis]